MFAINDSNFLSIQDRVQNCSFPQYPLLINEDKSDVKIDKILTYVLILAVFVIWYMFS